MEQFKKDIFYKEVGVEFPELEQLNIVDKEKIFDILKKILGTDDVENMFVNIEKMFDFRDYDEEYTYDINRMFSDFNLHYSGNTLIIWDIKTIDKISTKLLIENWNYIWYGSSDDAIILVQHASNKILLITHYGRIYFSDIAL